MANTFAGRGIGGPRSLSFKAPVAAPAPTPAAQPRNSSQRFSAAMGSVPNFPFAARSTSTIRSPTTKLARPFTFASEIVMSEPVGGRQRRVLGGQHLRQVDHH